VDLARQRAFNSIRDDSALSKYISDPSGEPRLLVSLLLETLVTASDYKGRAKFSQDYRIKDDLQDDPVII
jgi:hypothetical protein